MEESFQSILHHNRNIPALKEVYREDPLGGLTEEQYKKLAVRNMIANQLIPEYPAKIRMNPNDYVDLDKMDDEEFIYTEEQVINAMQSIEFIVPKDSDYHQFLLGRGVTQDQIDRFGLGTTENLTRDQRIYSGSLIHPAIEKHVNLKGEKEKGILFPIKDMDGQIIGTHVRMMNTLPGLKYSSSMSEGYLYHNIRKGEEIKEIFLLEGVFDCLAMDSLDPSIKWVSPSSGYLSTTQMVQLEKLRLDTGAQIHILLDKDGVGIYNTMLINFYFGKWADSWEISHPQAKDLAELVHFHGGTLKDLRQVSISELKEKWIAHEKTMKKEYSYEEYEENRQKNQHYSYNKK
jgi:hypothetical protein